MKWLLPAAFLGAIACLLYAQESAPIRVPVRLVLLPALVLSPAGKAVTGLEAKNFSVSDNGLRQAVRLDVESTLASVAIAIQTNEAMSDYVPFVAKTGSLLESALSGEGGRSAVLTYGDEIAITKRFGTGDDVDPMKKLSVRGSDARMLDAGMQAIALLKQESPERPRSLVFIGQSYDHGSSTTIPQLQRSAAEQNVTIHCLALPIAGKKFVADTFSLYAVNGGGYGGSVDLTKAIPALRRAGRQAAAEDDFSVLATATGGMRLRFRKQAQFENSLIALGTVIRSSYLLMFSPVDGGVGYHRLSVAVDVPGDKVYTRPGYWQGGE